MPAYSVGSGSEGILVVTCRVTTVLDNPLCMLPSEWILGLSVLRRKGVWGLLARLFAIGLIVSVWDIAASGKNALEAV